VSTDLLDATVRAVDGTFAALDRNVRAERDLRVYDYDLGVGDLVLRVYYVVTDAGRPARGPMQEFGSSIVECDEGEAPTVNMPKVALRRNGIEVPLPLALPSPELWSEIESEIVEALTAELDSEQ